MHVIRLFMWGYQLHFQCSMKVAVEQLCATLNPNLKANIFLVGLRTDQREDRHPVCLEPEDCYHHPDEFSRVLERARSFEETDPEGNILCSHPIAQENHDRRLKARALRRSLLYSLDQYSSSDSTKYYCSDLMPVSGYLVSTVIELVRGGDSSEHRLPRVHSDRFWQPKSLLDSALAEILHDAARALLVASPENVDDAHTRPTSDILRAAGRRLMDAPIYVGGNGLGIQQLFDSCCGISAQKYEGAEGLGTLFVARRDHPNIRQTLALQQPISLRSHRAARKLLEATSKGNNLLSDGTEIYGFGEVVGSYDQGRSDLFGIRFIHHHGWELLHGDQRMMVVRYGEPRLPLQTINEVKFKDDVSRIFGDGADGERLLELANIACRQRHGTILVISSEAQTEAERLKRQSTLIEPTMLADEVFKSVTAIDGAVVMDQSAKCYAIGVILDGLASPSGDPARGARYNSCVRYLEGKSGTLALIVSEDGSVEWIPDLRPRLSRTELEAKIQEIDGLLASDVYNRSRSIKLLDWLRSHSFYLSEELCAKINLYKTKYEAQSREAHDTTMVYGDFSPDASMDESYFC